MGLNQGGDKGKFQSVPPGHHIPDPKIEKKKSGTRLGWLRCPGLATNLRRGLGLIRGRDEKITSEIQEHVLP